MPDPAILFLDPVRGRDRPLADPLLVRRQGDVRGREAASRGDRADLLRRLDRADRRRTDRARGPGQYKVVTETAKVKGLLTGEGIRYLFTSFVSNFRNFSAVAIILVVMIGVGLAEAAG